MDPPIDLQGLPSLPPDPPFGMVLSSNGQALGAILFRYEWYVTGPARNQASLLIRWEHLVLCQAEIDSDASSLVALALIALSMQHARYAGAAHYGTYDVPTGTATTTTQSKESEIDTDKSISLNGTSYLDLFETCFRLVRLRLPAQQMAVKQMGPGRFVETASFRTVDSGTNSIAGAGDGSGRSSTASISARTSMETDRQEDVQEMTSKDDGEDKEMAGTKTTTDAATFDRTRTAAQSEDQSNMARETASDRQWAETASETRPITTRPLLGERIRLLADLNKSSTRYAVLVWKQLMQEKAQGHVAKVSDDDDNNPKQPGKYRSLLRLPNVEEATALLQGRIFKRKKLPGGSNTLSFYANAPIPQRSVTLRLQAVLQNDEKNIEMFVQNDEDEKTKVEIPQNFEEEPFGFHVMRTFPLQGAPIVHDDSVSDLLLDLKAKQAELAALESDMEPHLRELMRLVVEERLEYEKSDHLARRKEEDHIMEENRKMRERRAAEDQEKQKRLELDMDAVCCICNDGEVTPDNQIIFCESCDVPVHQHCYGVDKIPSEDYYCLACKFLGRDKEAEKDPEGSKRGPRELPLVCALCPHRGGALIRSNTPPSVEDKYGKWVHVVCAKWQGLNFVNPKKHDLVEDFTDLWAAFRLKHIKCDLCQGDRGCMIQCHKQGCESWMHLLCARSSGLCEVNHGEDCNGDVPDNPWTLLCQRHSNIKTENVPIDAIPVRKLIEMAKEFPPEPEPIKRPIAPMPFNQATGEERKRLLVSHDYEQALIEELLYKRHMGIRCEVCNSLTETSKDIIRCTGCAVSFCFGCKIESENVEGNYKCPSCLFIASKPGDEEAEPPHCIACFQKGGPLRPAFATPVKSSTWKKRKDYSKSIFVKNFFVHTICAL